MRLHQKGSEISLIAGHKFTELYNGASGKRCDMDGKPEGSIRGDESINVQHLTSNHLDPVACVTICTIQRLYAILRFLFFVLIKGGRRAKSREETGGTVSAFNEALRTPSHSAFHK